MARPLDIAGQRFDRLIAISRFGFNKHRQAMWLCQCDCGTNKVIAAHALRQKLTRSCGCLHRERAATLNFTNGMTQTPEWCAWYNMLARCYRQENKHFKDYGGRGISVCERWRASFEEFLADVGLRPSAMHSIDRINNDGNYEPGNCRWATWREQAHNRRPRAKA